jgi:hypothetical protein
MRTQYLIDTCSEDASAREQSTMYFLQRYANRSLFLELAVIIEQDCGLAAWSALNYLHHNLHFPSPEIRKILEEKFPPVLLNMLASADIQSALQVAALLPVFKHTRPDTIMFPNLGEILVDIIRDASRHEAVLKISQEVLAEGYNLDHVFADALPEILAGLSGRRFNLACRKATNENSGTIQRRTVNDTSVRSIVILSTVCVIASTAFDPQCQISFPECVNSQSQISLLLLNCIDNVMMVLRLL